MSSYLSYELLLNLKQIEVINIRQSSFFQIRVTILQSSAKEVYPVSPRVTTQCPS
jgi:hypothetical protein